MARLAARGIEMDLPEGWDGRISRRQTAPADARRAAPADDAVAQPPALAHAATRTLPTDIGDFGSGAVELLSTEDLFLALVEFEPDSLGSPLFSARGQPKRLRPTDFDPNALQRVLLGQAGAQVFFTTADRPFCLYVVLGSFARRTHTVPVINSVLEGIRIT